jgi:hypothetical protein
MQRKGIFVYETNMQQFHHFIVEFNDGTAELFNDWDSAVEAGGFDLTDDE